MDTNYSSSVQSSGQLCGLKPTGVASFPASTTLLRLVEPGDKATLIFRAYDVRSVPDRAMHDKQNTDLGHGAGLGGVGVGDGGQGLHQGADLAELVASWGGLGGQGCGGDLGGSKLGC